MGVRAAGRRFAGDRRNDEGSLRNHDARPAMPAQRQNRNFSDFHGFEKSLPSFVEVAT